MELYNDDAIDILNEYINDEIQVDCIITDPPYKVTKRGNAGNAGGMLQKKINMSGNVFKHNDLKISDYSQLLFDVLKDGGHMYIMTNHVNLTSMLNELQRVGFHFIKSLIWLKDNKVMGQAYMSQFEYILFFRKGKFNKINNCGTSDVLQFANKKSKDLDGTNLHDTEKPVDLMKILIENSTLENQVVLDAFMGIGSTGIACNKLNREFIGIELDEKYFNIAKERINASSVDRGNK